MKRYALVVDDDRVLRNLILKKCQKYREHYTIIVAEDGIDALEKMVQYPISLVVTDLNMPRMDGFELITRLLNDFPDVSIIVLTGTRLVKWRKDMLRKSTFLYIEKPFVVERLAETIRDTLKKDSEGGVLYSISLETFVQLLEMDGKTCTIRTLDKQSAQEGVLFFKEGELVDARVGSVRGEPAVMQMLAWDKPTIFIQNDCASDKRTITESMQALLLEAMRLRDEG